MKTEARDENTRVLGLELQRVKEKDISKGR